MSAVSCDYVDTNAVLYVYNGNSHSTLVLLNGTLTNIVSVASCFIATQSSKFPVHVAKLSFYYPNYVCIYSTVMPYFLPLIRMEFPLFNC